MQYEIEVKLEQAPYSHSRYYFKTRLKKLGVGNIMGLIELELNDGKLERLGWEYAQPDREEAEKNTIDTILYLTGKTFEEFVKGFEQDLIEEADLKSVVQSYTFEITEPKVKTISSFELEVPDEKLPQVKKFLDGVAAAQEAH